MDTCWWPPSAPPTFGSSGRYLQCRELQTEAMRGGGLREVPPLELTPASDPHHMIAMLIRPFDGWIP